MVILFISSVLFLGTVLGLPGGIIQTGTTCPNFIEGGSNGIGGGNPGKSYWTNIDQNTCFNYCKADPICTQSVYESTGPWGPGHCWIGTGVVTPEDGFPGNRCPTCVDNCYYVVVPKPTPKPTPRPTLTPTSPRPTPTPTISCPLHSAYSAALSSCICESGYFSNGTTGISLVCILLTPGDVCTTLRCKVWALQQNITVTNTNSGIGFGCGLWHAPDGIVIGQYTKPGWAHLFKYLNSAWTFQQSLTGVDGASAYADFDFGTFAASSNTQIVVSDWSTNDWFGGVYLYKSVGGSFTLQQTFKTGKHMAWSPDGTLLAIGTQGTTVAGKLGTGIVEVFKYEGSSYVNKQTLTGYYEYSYFHHCIFSPDGSQLLVGAFNVFEVGAVYVFKYVGVTWTLQLTINSPGQRYNNFGLCISYSPTGTEFAVGTYFRAGGAYVYSSVGTLKQTLAPPQCCHFGYRIVYSPLGNQLVISTLDYDTWIGYVYVYISERGSWILQQAITSNNWYGTGTLFSRDGSQLLVSASGSSTNKGFTYVYKSDCAAPYVTVNGKCIYCVSPYILFDSGCYICPYENSEFSAASKSCKCKSGYLSKGAGESLVCIPCTVDNPAIEYTCPAGFGSCAYAYRCDFTNNRVQVSSADTGATVGFILPNDMNWP